MLLRHVGIVVQDMDVMKKYYQKVLHLKVLSDDIEKVRIVKLGDAKGNVIELLAYESQSPVVLRKKGISHISFTEDPEGTILEIVKENRNAKYRGKKTGA